MGTSEGAKRDRARAPSLDAGSPLPTSRCDEPGFTDTRRGDTSIELELPFVIGVLADFCGSGKHCHCFIDRTFVSIDCASFGEVMKQLQPTLEFRVKNILSSNESDVLPITLVFQSLDDFAPQRVIEQVPLLKDLLEVRKTLLELECKLHPQEKAADRGLWEFDQNTFDETMKHLAPRLACKVDDALNDEPSKLQVKLDFSSVEDFDPQAVIEKIPQLKKLLEIKNNLARFLESLKDNEELVSEVTKAIGSLQALSSFSDESISCREPDPTESTSPPKSDTYLPDENVQFTVYRPRHVVPKEWYPFLVFAHLDELPPNALPEERHPLDEVKERVAAALGAQQELFRPTTQESDLAVPREGEITFVPRITACEFRPSQQTFQWAGRVHQLEFSFRALTNEVGQTTRGHLTVYLGHLIIASIPLSVRVDPSPHIGSTATLFQARTSKAFRKIFASYSHRDTEIVEELEGYAKSVGDVYLRDVATLRAGDVWDERLAQLIKEADLFQLFWSTHSMYSPHVEDEWRYALSLHRLNFVRPTYWQKPFPRDEQRNLPPPELAAFHFQYLGRQAESKLEQQPGLGVESRLEGQGDDSALMSGSPDSSESKNEQIAPQKHLKRIRKPRVHIRYTPSLGDEPREAHGNDSQPAGRQDAPSTSPNGDAEGQAPLPKDDASLMRTILEEMPDWSKTADSNALPFVMGCISELLQTDKSLAATVRSIINEMDSKLSQQLRHVLHAFEFRRLEGTWRGLCYLAKRCWPFDQVKIRILHCTKDELKSDLGDVSGLAQSLVFRRVAEGLEVREPFGLMIGDHEFDPSGQSINLLSDLAQLGAALNCPVLVGAGPKMFGIDRWEQFQGGTDLKEVGRGRHYVRWEEFRRSSDSRYVALGAPPASARSYYKAENLDGFLFTEFDESETSAARQSCRMNAAYVIAARVVEAFAQREHTDSQADDTASVRKGEFPGITEGAGEKEQACPTEVAITPEAGAELSELGFVPLLHPRDTGVGFVNEMRTAHAPLICEKAAANSSEEVFTQLPQLLIASHWMHRVQLAARDRCGAYMRREDLQASLNAWLQQHGVPRDGVPAKNHAGHLDTKAHVEVHEIPSEPGQYQIVLHVFPHDQMGDWPLALALVGQLPTAPTVGPGQASCRDAESGTLTSQEAEPASPDSPSLDQVHFTAYIPQFLLPDQWSRLLMFAHLGDLKTVEERARSVLREKRGQHLTQTRISDFRIAPECPLLFVLNVPGVVCDESRIRRLWVGEIEQVEFRLKAATDYLGQNLAGNVTVYFDGLILVSFPVEIQVTSTPPELGEAGFEPHTLSPYENIFVSYAHEDQEIIELCERVVKALGHRYLRDAIHLRSGERWSTRLEQFIREADVFQLFWSSRSMMSQHVEREWRYALSLNRPFFVRPTYWEDPMPTDPDRNLPPPELLDLHFEHL